MYKDRIEAAEKLAEKIKSELGEEVLKESILLGIPRGGVEIALELRRILSLPYDSVVTKKIPAPGDEAVTIGAMSEGGVIVWEDKICEELGVDLEYKHDIVKQKLEEMGRKEAFYRRGKPLPDLKDKIAIIVDDCIVTGTAMKAAIGAIRVFKPREIIVVVPVIAKEELIDIQTKADRVVYLDAPEVFFSMTEYYADHEQASDEELDVLMNKLWS